ncbi:OPI10-like protein [Pyrus ussuriensis x Pyrus communis]|uniref:OPI10-like protein n=1 Tax=Pyrus ussuriensis x Pyrus communis TaxID=2448454 RepID=A0A5N5GMJ8_9ROSA|nr:OPI10-like protein [Pyrus ussuriensis x Pyrus communis]KAB2631826.1 OPI10-like protein [Pyrus ussuriensis x Pyrus communis]
MENEVDTCYTLTSTLPSSSVTLSLWSARQRCLLFSGPSLEKLKQRCCRQKSRVDGAPGDATVGGRCDEKQIERLTMNVGEICSILCDLIILL